MKDAIVIPLEFWQNPVEDVILIFSERRCSVYFACWDEKRKPEDFIAHLAFERVPEVRSVRTDRLPYRIQESQRCHSYILEIPDSDLVCQYVASWNLRVPQFPMNVKEMRHFVVKGHDIYHEIVAKSVKITTIPNDQVTDSALRALIDL